MRHTMLAMSATMLAPPAEAVLRPLADHGVRRVSGQAEERVYDPPPVVDRLEVL